MEKIRGLLEIADFSDYEKEVYLSIYSIGKGSVKEIYSNCSVPKPKVYSVLERLHEDGFISLEADDPKTYSVIDPGTAFRPLLDQRRKEIQELEKNIEKASEKLADQGEENFLKIMRGRDTVLEFLAEQLEEVEEEYITVGRFVSSYTPLQPVMEERNSEIEMKFLGPEEGSKQRILKKYRNMGLQVKTREMEAIPFRFSIYDRKKLALTLTDSKDGYITIWTNQPSFVENIYEFFEYHWNNAE